jgi:hypothetical protein
MMPTLSCVMVGRELTAKQRAVLRRLSDRKLYDRNHPKDGTFVILRRAFLPACHDNRPNVVLLCRVTKDDPRGRFEYVVFVDGLYGAGHWPSDSYGAGTMKDAMASFEEHLVCQLFGYWPWVITKGLRSVRAFVDGATTRQRRRA